MKQADLPFIIDQQFENWEFELDFLPQRKLGYFSFRYIGNEMRYFYNIPIMYSELIFNADFLTAVKLEAKNLNLCLSEFLKQSDHIEIVIFKNYQLYKNEEIFYYFNFNESTIIYGKTFFMMNFLSFYEK
ncbi:hypothetical protein BWK59_00870 [Flavobacterium davisii]|uniref:Uncharacterized protein n=1 Tax=Flavobacterium davisii TaxID=2906077 RepID=A0A246GLM8_9FLAO|nr:hypothetical protein [Flavobacterium davisii]OWP85319.1 hypothetical protein BWK59_00870 [Flavobacterium davisii]